MDYYMYCPDCGFGNTIGENEIENYEVSNVRSSPIIRTKIQYLKECPSCFKDRCGCVKLKNNTDKSEIVMLRSVISLDTQVARGEI